MIALFRPHQLGVEASPCCGGQAGPEDPGDRNPAYPGQRLFWIRGF